MKAMMNKIVNDCETTSYLITRHLGKQNNTIKTMQMYMHLMGCPHCRKNFKQQKTISKKIRLLSQLNGSTNLKHKLSSEEKELIKNSLTKF